MHDAPAGAEEIKAYRKDRQPPLQPHCPSRYHVNRVETSDPHGGPWDALLCGGFPQEAHHIGDLEKIPTIWSLV